jgi:hypothetical protein
MSNQSSIREVVRKLSEKYGFPYEEGMKNIECVENSKEVLLSSNSKYKSLKTAFHKVLEREIIAAQSRLDRALEEAIAAKGGRR